MASSMMGINKRAREQELEEANKQIKDPLNSFIPFEAELGEIQRNSRFGASYHQSADSDSSDDEINSDKMDLDDGIHRKGQKIEGNEQLSLTSNGNWNIDKSYPPRPKVNHNHNHCSVPEESDSDSFIRVMKGGKLRYTRRIDMLVDDLIRKTKRTLDWAGNSSELSSIPSSIGPHPLTDLRMLSINPQNDDDDDDDEDIVIDCNPIENLSVEDKHRSSRTSTDNRHNNNINNNSHNKSHQSLPLQIIEIPTQRRGSFNSSTTFETIASSEKRILRNETNAQQRHQQQQQLHLQQQQQVQQKRDSILQSHSGDVTHSDWPIEVLDKGSDD